MKIAAYLIEKIGSTVSGYFHPSLWLSESHELLVAQRFDGIELGRLDGRPHADEQSDRGDHGRNNVGHLHDGVEFLNLLLGGCDGEIVLASVRDIAAPLEHLARLIHSLGEPSRPCLHAHLELVRGWIGLPEG